MQTFIIELCRRICSLETRVDDLNSEIKLLEDKYNNLKNKNSRNSSLPPSKDPPFKPNTNKDKPHPKAASRESNKEKKPNGGQKGHKGHRLEPVENPDKCVYHYLDSTPDGIALGEKDIVRFAERQEFEILKPTIIITDRCGKLCFFHEPESG